MSRFEELLTGVKEDLNVLPLIHTCDGYGYRSILESEKIETSQCKVLGDNYSYAFYGRPAYKIFMKGATREDMYFPVCFILNQNHLPNFCRMYPFDSGAFITMDEIKSRYFHKRMDITDFQVSADIKNAVKIVKRFYSSNKRYIDEDPIIDAKDFLPSEFEARGYAKLIAEKSVGDFDNRVSTVEIVYDMDIELNSDNLMQVIIPCSLADDPKLMSLLKGKYNIVDPIVYDTGRGNPLECHGKINDKYKEYIELGGKL